MDNKNNTMINLNMKGNLAKLLATENITVQQDNVKTASFDVKNRILTLPIFENQSGDVFDMLIAHECSHALYTPNKHWQEIANDDELRSYVNVLEDTRIDHLIQKKYPGVVRNYLNGFDILNKQDFFGIQNMNINTDLMLIDKINMRSKSMNRLPIEFNAEEKKILDKVDSLKTFNQVVKLAKEMIDWQKNQLKKKKLPNLDELIKNYGDVKQSDNDSKSTDNQLDAQGNQKDSDSDVNQNSDDAEKSDDEGKNSASKKSDEKKEDEKDTSSQSTIASTGGDGLNKLKSITDKNYENNKQNKLVDSKHKGFEYVSLPEPNMSEVIISYKTFLKRFKDHIAKQGQYDSTQKYKLWLKDEFNKFKTENKKTVMYLVKEFEMKKAATAYKRSSTDKTGVIDPLKLKDYRFSDDIFKRMNILPDAKNHGMMMLLDWSGSMSDCLYQTVEQLINLTYFCQKVNIPFEVYFFSSEKSYEKVQKNFKYKEGDMYQEPMFLVNIASHRMKKTELDESMMYMFHMANYYHSNYNRRSFEDYQNYLDRGNDYGIPGEYHLGSTPLNEALTVCEKLVPMFKNKYKIEKMTFITLTDGGANSSSSKVVGEDYQGKDQWDRAAEKSGIRIASRSFDKKLVIKEGKKYYTTDNKSYWRTDVTDLLLNIIRKKHNVSTVGFYVLKGRRHETDRFFNAWGMSDKERVIAQKRKDQWLKNLVCDYPQPGYNKYFLLNGKKMSIQTTDQGLNEINTDMKAGRIKQLFSKNMKGRITSRVLLNKFIEEVA